MEESGSLEDEKKIFDKGLNLYSRRQYIEALPYFERIIHKELLVLKYYYLGLTLVQLNRFEEGLKAYRKIREVPVKIYGIEYDRFMYGLYINMGSVLQFLAKRKEKKLYYNALECYNWALKIKKTDERLWNNLGNVLLEIKNFKKSIKCFKKALEINDEYPEAHYSISLVYEELKKFKKSLYHLKKALIWKSRSKVILNRIAGVSFGLENFKEAKEYAERVLEIDPKDSTAIKNLSLILYNLENFQEAYLYYQKLMEIGTKIKDQEVKEIFKDLKLKVNGN